MSNELNVSIKSFFCLNKELTDVFESKLIISTTILTTGEKHLPLPVSLGGQDERAPFFGPTQHMHCTQRVYHRPVFN